jgi:hypothetical protein
VLIKISDGLFQSRDHTVFLIVSWEYDTQAHFSGLDVASVGSGIGFGRLNVLLPVLALCKPAVVPAWQRLGLCSSGSGMARDVLLLGGVNGTRLWRDEMENDI